MFSCLFQAAAWVWSTWGGKWLRISHKCTPYPLLVSKWSAGRLPNQVWKKQGWHEERKSTGERECCRMINKKGKGNRERRCGNDKDLGALKEIRDRKMCAVTDLGRLFKYKSRKPQLRNISVVFYLSLSLEELSGAERGRWQEERRGVEAHSAPTPFTPQSLLLRASIFSSSLSLWPSNMKTSNLSL